MHRPFKRNNRSVTRVAFQRLKKPKLTAQLRTSGKRSENRCFQGGASERGRELQDEEQRGAWKGSRTSHLGPAEQRHQWPHRRAPKPRRPRTRPPFRAADFNCGGCMLTPPSQKSGPNREVRCLLEQTFPGENVHQKLTLQARGSFPDKLTRCPSGHVLDRGPGSFLTLMPTRPQTCLRRASAL